MSRDIFDCHDCDGDMLLTSKHPTIDRAASTTTDKELSCPKCQVEKSCYSFIKDTCFIQSVPKFHIKKLGSIDIYFHMWLWLMRTKTHLLKVVQGTENKTYSQLTYRLSFSTRCQYCSLTPCFKPYKLKSDTDGKGESTHLMPCQSSTSKENTQI